MGLAETRRFADYFVYDTTGIRTRCALACTHEAAAFDQTIRVKVNLHEARYVNVFPFHLVKFYNFNSTSLAFSEGTTLGIAARVKFSRNYALNDYAFHFSHVGQKRNCARSM